jgi:hypothetical protein
LLLPVGDAAAESDQELAARAQERCQAALVAGYDSAAGRALFRQAADDYEKLRQRGYGDAALLQSEGNAYFLAGDIPRAILAYQRGLREAPGARSLRTALQSARQHAESGNSHAERAGFLGLIRPAFRRCELAALFWTAIACYCLSWIGWARWWMTRERSYLVAAIAALLGALLTAGCLAADWIDLDEDATHPLVVAARAGVILHTGNGGSYPARLETPLQPGVEGRLRFERDDWLQIRLVTGETGWVSRGDVLVDR